MLLFRALITLRHSSKVSLSQPPVKKHPKFSPFFPYEFPQSVAMSSYIFSPGNSAIFTLPKPQIPLLNRSPIIEFNVSAKFSQSSSLRIGYGRSSISIHCSNQGKSIGTISESFDEPKLEDGGGGDDNSGGDGGGDGNGNKRLDLGGNDNDDNDDDEEKDGEDEFGPIVKYDEVIRELEKRGGAVLPDDMIEAAKSVGLRRLILTRYLDLQGSGWLLGFLMRYCSMLRDRMLADPSFLFKVGTEVVIDSCCATFAEVNKRGKDFWAEFELYAADLLVGIVVDVALVGMLAPYARIGKQPVSSAGFLGRAKHVCGTLPSSVFEAERPGVRFSVQQRIATYFYKGLLYGAVGFGCGIIGQGIANTIMTAKRNITKSEEDVPIPPLVQSAALWGVFLAVSSNTRYQIVNGLEFLVEKSPLAKQVPPIAMAFTVGVRFANNIYGGMQFVDWAKLSGVQ